MLIHIFNITILSIVIFGLSSAEPKFPAATCKQDSADYSACLKRALEEAWPRFVKGLPEFDFPSLDPLFYEHGKLILNSGELRGELDMFNLTAIGLSKTHFNDVRTHYINDIFYLEIDAHVPILFVESDMKINGSLNVFRIDGGGHLNVTANDIRGTWNLTGRIINDTWIVEHFHINPSLGMLKIYIDNLFEDNKVFNNVIVQFVNEYWPAIYRTILPFFSNVWDSWLTEISNKIFSKVSFSKIFPM